VFELTPVEIVGYLASALVVLSLAMSSVVRLRILSLAGSVTFLFYGVMIESIPIILTNLSIAGINIWYLRLELGLHRDLGVSPVPIDSPFLADFLAFHLDDIRRFQPDATIPAGDDDVLALLVTRDGLPAGVVIGHREDTTLDISIDYVLRAYRDSRLGQWLFGDGAGVFRSAGFTRLSSRPGTDQHRHYLEHAGFRPDGDRYVLELSSPVR
jgi:hypothetical protein